MNGLFTNKSIIVIFLSLILIITIIYKVNPMNKYQRYSIATNKIIIEIYLLNKKNLLHI